MKKSMLMILKRITVTAIAAAFAFSLAACSREDDNQDEESRYVFNKKYSLVENKRQIINKGEYFLKDDNLYYITEGEYDDSLGGCSVYVSMCNLSDGNVTELFQVKPADNEPADGEGYVSADIKAIRAEDNGDITVIIHSSTTDDSGESLEEILKKNTYSPQGEKKDVCDIDISGLSEDEYYGFSSCRLSGQGDIYVLFRDYETDRREVYKYNPDGSQDKNFELNVPGVAVEDIILDSNDRPIVIYDEESADGRVYTSAAYIDMDKCALGTKLDGIVNGKDNIFRYFSVYSAGSDSTFLINDENALSEYDVSTGLESVICNWMDCGLSGIYVIYAVKCENGNVFCLYNDGDVQGDPEHIIAGFIEKTDISDDDRTVIRVASSYFGVTLPQAIVKMNRDNEKYRVELVSYSEYENSDERLRYDIMAGNVPDVIWMGDIDTNYLISREYLEDLSPYIKEDDVLNEDYFLDGFLDAIKIDGKNYFIGDSFGISALVGKKSDLSGYEDGWTVDDFIEYCKSKPEGTSIFANTTKQKVCYALIGHNMGKFIDWNTGKCSFDGEEFKKLLEFCNGVKTGDIPADSEYELSDHAKPIKEGKLLFENGGVSSITDIQVYKTVFDNDEMYIGYPSDSDNGIYLDCGGLGIFASSAHKDESWDFIKKLFISVFSKDADIMSASKDGFEKHFRRSSSSDHYGIFYGVHIEPAKREEADAVKELLKKSKYRYSTFEEYKIIEEDISRYFEGEKGLDETVRVIQDRMDKYVNENR